MRVVGPQRPEGQVWLQHYQRSYAQWVQSGFEEGASAEAMVEALRGLVEREPACAGFVMVLAAACGFQHDEALPLAVATELAELARAADSLAADGEAALLRCWLAADLGRCRLRVGRLREAVGLAEEAAAVDGGGALGDFLRLRATALRGAALDARLEFGAALDLHRTAAALAAALVEDRERLARLLAEVVPLLVPGEGHADAFAAAYLHLLHAALSRFRIDSAVAAARCAAFLDDPVLDDAAVAACEAIAAHGLGKLRPADLAPIVAQADLDVATELFEVVLKQASALGLPVADFEAVLCAAVSRRITGKFGEATAARALRAVLSSDDPVARATAVGLMLAGEHGEGLDELFLSELHDVGTRRTAVLDDPRIRSLLDEPVALVLDRLLDRVAADDGDDLPGRARLGQIVDLGLIGRTDIDRWLPPGAGEGHRSDSLALADALAADLLGRLDTALASWPDAVAVVMRTRLDGGTTFLVSGSFGQVVARADADCTHAANALVELFRRGLDELQFDVQPPPTSAFEEAAQALYDALPVVVREALAAAAVVLLCPDRRTGGDAVPWELLHDGTSWLGVRAATARFPSMEVLVRSLEGGLPREPRRRALVLAVPDAEGEDHLAFAADEAVVARQQLRDHGWDVPEIDTARIGRDFVIDRLPFVAHLHVVAHGWADAREERLLLAGGEELSAGDLADRFFPRVPTAYVNACSVGRTRYIGGGVSRGIAHTLVERGAPAVVANLLPVDDLVSSELAASFYEAALRTGFGEALRQAREDSVGRGDSPLLWGSTVLLGDPRTTLISSPTASPLPGHRLLETMLTGAGDAEAVHAEVAERLGTTTPDVHLAASITLLRQISEWDEPKPEIRAGLADATRVARRLGHRPAIAILGLLLAQTYDDEVERDEALVVVEGVLEHLETLEVERPELARHTDMLLARWMRLRQGKRAPVTVVRGGNPEDEEANRLLGEAVFDIELAVEARELRRGAVPVSRSQPRTAEDMARNAVLAARELRFESMPEAFDAARRVVAGLVAVGALPEVSDDVSIGMAGLLRRLWDGQHVASFGTEMAEGQAGTVLAFVDAAADHWPPAEAGWLDCVRPFAEELRERLAAIDDMSYFDDDLYPRIDELPAFVEDGVRAAVARVRELQPDRVPDAAAWLLGSVIAANTFSYLDGSVPEAICDRLERGHDALFSAAEGWFMPWLMEGFEAARTREPDELARWKHGLGEPVD